MVCTHLLALPYSISTPWPVPEKKHPICFLLVCLQLFSHILKREFQEKDAKHLSRKFTEWVYGPVTCSLYDLACVDSYQKNSALEILVYGSDVPVSPISISISPQCHVFLNSAVFHQNRHEMLQTAPLGQLLESKWKKFAGHMFCLNFLFYLVYLIVFTAVAYNKNEGWVSLQQHLLGLVVKIHLLLQTCALFFFPQWINRIEHTFLGYAYISGQLLTALANCYFFITGVRHFHLFKIKVIMSHKSRVLYPKKWF